MWLTTFKTIQCQGSPLIMAMMIDEDEHDDDVHDDNDMMMMTW